MTRLIAYIGASCIVLVFLPFRAWPQDVPAARIADAVMAKAADEVSSEPLGEVEAYPMWSEYFTCCVDVIDVFKETHIKSVWYYFDKREIVPIDSTVIRIDQPSWIAFTLQHGGRGWPYGAYEIAVSTGNGRREVVSFGVNPTFPASDITEVVLTESLNDENYPLQPRTEFQPTTEPLYACIYIRESVATHEYGARWYQVLENENDFMLAQAKLEHDGPGWISFSLLPDSPLPSGEYFVNILYDGEVEHKVPFTIE